MTRRAVIRTSDRALFRRCRRKWSIESGLRAGRRIKETPSYFWLGTGGHFALEDYHGYNYYGHPVEAFRAYVTACQKAASLGKGQLPIDWEEQKALGEGILMNYLDWLSTRAMYNTYWVNGEPQVELKCSIPIPIDHPDYDEVYYQFQLDKVVEDFEGNLWIVDYKFYKTFGQGLLEFDGQLNAYIWATQQLYDRPVVGAMLHEFRKEIPNEPRILQNGTLSTAKNQKTTYYLYRQAMIRMFGSVNAATLEHQDCLNELLSRETEYGNDFIRMTRTYRTPQQIVSEGSKIIMELEDMLNPNLPCYPNPTKDCSWDCQHKEVCILMDRGDDWEGHLELTTTNAAEVAESWRDYLPIISTKTQEIIIE